MSRVFAPLDKPWDLMSWSFYKWRLRKLDPPASRKPAIQLMREGRVLGQCWEDAVQVLQ